MSTLSVSSFALPVGRHAGGQLKRLCTAVLALVIIASLGKPSWAAVIYDVNINTTGLAGISGTLAFDFIDGDGANNNTVSITQLTTDGIGLDTSDVTISDVVFFNEVQRPLTFGTYLSFNFSATTNFLGGTPDAFSFFLLNSAATQSLIATNDPLGTNSLFSHEIGGSAAGQLAAYSVSDPQGVSATISAIPEPTSLLTWSLMAVGIGAVSRRRAKQAIGTPSL